jgi:hypothetical protein
MLKERGQYLKSTHQFPSQIGKINICSVNYFPCFPARALLSTPFLLSVDKGRLSKTGLVLGPCMIEDIEGALWPIYGTCLSGQYRIVLPLLQTTRGSMVPG